METKTCRKCKQEKATTDFSRQYKDGKRHTDCRECKAVYYRQWYQKNGRKRADNYSQLIYLYEKNHKREVSVKHRVYRAIKGKKLERPLMCFICGRISRINAHHNDYDKPFGILWVCSSCHKKIHLGLLSA